MEKIWKRSSQGLFGQDLPEVIYRAYFQEVLYGEVPLDVFYAEDV